MNHCQKLERIWPTQKQNTRWVCHQKPWKVDICLTKQLTIFHRASSKVFIGCLSSIPIPLLLIETQLPLLKTNLKPKKALSCFRQILRLLQESFKLSALSLRSVISRLKKKPCWRSYCLSTKKPFSLAWTLIICPPFPLRHQSSLQYHLLYLIAVALAHPTLNTLRINCSPFLLQTCRQGPMDLSNPH